MSDAQAAFLVRAPADQIAPIVFASSHSGRDYPAAFLAAARLDPLTLRRSEDCFVDELFASAPRCGVPLLAATFPRAWCDPNREAFELDPAMFDGPLPGWVNTDSARVQAGLGTIARVVASGEALYRDKLSFAEAHDRVRSCWRPWHGALQTLMDATIARFGTGLLIDCHSMPSAGAGRAKRQADIVVGDLHGTTCAAEVTRRVESILSGLGYTVARNEPYAGGYTIRRHGRPRDGVHALQIELSRDLYMDQQRIEKHAGFVPLEQRLEAFIRAVVLGVPALLVPRPMAAQ